MAHVYSEEAGFISSVVVAVRDWELGLLMAVGRSVLGNNFGCEQQGGISALNALSSSSSSSGSFGCDVGGILLAG